MSEIAFDSFWVMYDGEVREVAEISRVTTSNGKVKCFILDRGENGYTVESGDIHTNRTEAYQAGALLLMKRATDLMSMAQKMFDQAQKT